MVSNGQKPLQEKDFIQEGYKKNPYPLWLWLTILTMVAALIWGGNSWYFSKLDTILDESPFLQVTNRDFSLFLWANPQYMRINSKNKEAYLTGFQYAENVAPIPGLADSYVVAPPEVLFLYHTWKRQVGNEFTQRPIIASEFIRFLDHSKEWLPDNWSSAPASYSTFVKQLKPSDNELSLANIPLPVQMAFQGWKNYFIEGAAVNNVTPTIEQMKEFLQSHQGYARNFWRNIFLESTPNYLADINSARDGESAVPKNNMEGMLKAAIFNWLQTRPAKKAEAIEKRPSIPAEPKEPSIDIKTKNNSL